MTKEIRNPKSETRNPTLPMLYSSLGIRSSFGFRSRFAGSFGFRIFWWSYSIVAGKNSLQLQADPHKQLQRGAERTLAAEKDGLENLAAVTGEALFEAVGGGPRM